MSLAPAAVPAGSRRDERRWVLFTTVGLGAFIVGLDNTILNIALPAIQHDLNMSLTGLQWVGTSYILAFASLLLVGGRLTDLIGRRRALVAGLAIFVVSSVVAGLAPGGGWLIAARVVQGVGGALVLPSTFAVIGTDLEGEDRHLGIGIWTASLASAIALGPIFGGAIVAVAHWGWVFFINLPLGALCIALVLRTVRTQAIELPPRPELLKRLDIPGLVTASIALMGVTFYLVHGQDYGFGSVIGLVAIAIGVFFSFAFVWTERHTDYPLVELELFRNRIYSGGTAAQIIWGLGINGILFFTSLFLQDIIGMGPLQAGLMYVPLALGIALTVPLGVKMSSWIGVNYTVAIGMLLIAIGLWHGTIVQADDPYWNFLIGLIIVGLGSGLTTPMTSAVLDVIPTEHAGTGSAVMSTAREISGIVGIVGMGAVLVVRRSSALESGASPEAAFMSGFHAALWAGTVVIAIGAVVAWLTLTTKAEALEIAALRTAEEEAGGPEREGSDFLDSNTPGDFAVALAEAHEIVHADRRAGASSSAGEN